MLRIGVGGEVVFDYGGDGGCLDLVGLLGQDPQLSMWDESCYGVSGSAHIRVGFASSHHQGRDKDVGQVGGWRVGAHHA